MGKKSRQKGKEGERQAAKYLGGKRTWWHEHDVWAKGRYWEVKRTKQGFTACYDALEEYQRHNEESGEDGTPIVIARHDRKPWIVIMFAEDYLREQDENNSSIPRKGQRTRTTDNATLGRTQPQT
jgi:hypothetical protein